MNKSASPRDVIIVIGGAGGIGSAIVQRFVQSGSFVIIGDKDQKRGSECASRSGPAVISLSLDVTKDDSIEKFVEKLKSLNLQVTHIVESAGITVPGEEKGIKGASFQAISDSIDLNLKAHIRITQALLPLIDPILENNRSITYVSSINAIVDCGGPGYSAAKAGILGLVRACTSELGKEGIRVNAVLPGTVRIPNTKSHDDSLEVMVNKTALGRLAKAEEIAEIVYAIASNLTCITGQYIVADCGQSVRLK